METTGHEQNDVSVRPIVIFASVLFAALLASAGAGWVLLRYYEAREAARSAPTSPLAATTPREPPPPRLQTEPRLDLERLRASEDALLHGYAWVDRQAGVVRIPIERAMALIAERAAAPGKR